jgi:retron-type reverse transcriptase
VSFGSLDHEILLGILAEKIHDNRFLRLMRHMLKAGYLEDWEFRDTLSGVPQGGPVSPILSNVYLHKLDEFVEQELIPQYTRGALRAANPAYRQVDALLRRAKRRGDRAEARRLALEMRTLPSTDPMDPGYRRLKFIRYADLCRPRHKSAYAEVRVMPTLASDALVRAVGGYLLSALSCGAGRWSACLEWSVFLRTGR